MWVVAAWISLISPCVADDAPPSDHGVTVLRSDIPLPMPDTSGVHLPVYCVVVYRLPASGIPDAVEEWNCPSQVSLVVGLAASHWRFGPVTLSPGSAYAIYQAVFQLFADDGATVPTWHLGPTPPVVQRASPVDGAGVHTIDEDQVHVWSRMQPSLPRGWRKEVRAAGGEVECKVRLTVDEKGVPDPTYDVTCLRGWTDPVGDAATFWQFQPLVMNGVPVKFYYVADFLFGEW